MLDVDAHNYKHCKPFRSCQLLGPSTSPATYKNVLVWYIFNLESREACCSAAFIASVTLIRDIVCFHRASYLH